MAKKRPAKKKSTTRARSNRRTSAKATDRVALKESTTSQKHSVVVVKLGQAAQTLALARTAMSAVKCVPAAMPIRESYSDAELASKDASRVRASTRPVSIQVDAITPSVPPTQPISPPPMGAVTSRVGNVAQMPYSTVGRIDVTAHPIDQNGNIAPGGNPISWMGTGFVVGERTIYSAAHVLETPTKSNGTTYKITSALFRPQHPSNIRSWSATNIIIHKDYFGPNLNTNLVFDMAAMVTDPNDSAIAPVTGKLGWKTTGVSLPTQTDAIGYPSDPATSFGFNGNVMWSSVGQTRQGSAINFRQKDNDMTRGCSGGPWVEDEGGVDGQRAIGLNSHVTDVSDYDPMISPVFDDDFLEVIRGVKELEVNLNSGVSQSSPNYIRLL